MCYWVRDPDRQRAGVTQQPMPPEGTRLPFIRPRIAGAVAVALVALVAAAALLLPASTTAVSSETSAAPVAATNFEATSDRSGVVIEQTSTVVDDGVPSSTEVARSSVRGSGHCDHGL